MGVGKRCLAGTAWGSAGCPEGPRDSCAVNVSRVLGGPMERAGSINMKEKSGSRDVKAGLGVPGVSRLPKTPRVGMRAPRVLSGTRVAGGLRSRPC